MPPLPKAPLSQILGTAPKVNTPVPANGRQPLNQILNTPKAPDNRPPIQDILSGKITAPSLGSRVGTDIQSAGSNVNNAITGTGQYAGQSAVARGTGAASEAASGVANVASEVLPQSIRAGLGEVGRLSGVAVNWLGQHLIDPKAAEQYVTQNPGAAKVLEDLAHTGLNAGNVAGNILMADAGAKGLNAVKNDVGALGSKIQDSFTHDANGLPNTLYHGADASTASLIKDNGFKASDKFPGSGSVNLTTSEDAAKAFAGDNGKVLPVKVGAKNVQTFNSMDEYSKALDAQGGVPGAEAEKNIMGNKDAIYIKNADGAGNGMVLVKDPKAVSIKGDNGGLLSNTRTALQEKYVNDLAEKYREVSGGTKVTTKRLARSVAQGKDPAQYLAERNIKPTVEGGKMRTMEQADTLHKSVDPLNEHLNTALDEVQPGIPKIKLSDVRRQAIANAEKLPNLTETARTQIKTAINKEFDLQQEKLGDSITLRQLNDIKKAQWADTKFDATAPYKTEATYNIGKAAKETIERSVPKDAIDVKELNNEIGKAYDAEKFLRSLDGNAVKGGRLGRYFGRVTGAIIGKALPIPGGEIVGALGGDAVAKILQSNTFSNPLKELILRNLQMKDPAAYTQAIKFVDDAKLIREARLKLPPGAPQGTEGNPHITPNTQGTPNSRVPGASQDVGGMRQRIPNGQGGFMNLEQMMKDVGGSMKGQGATAASGLSSLQQAKADAVARANAAPSNMAGFTTKQNADGGFTIFNKDGSVFHTYTPQEVNSMRHPIAPKGKQGPVNIQFPDTPKVQGQTYSGNGQTPPLTQQQIDMTNWGRDIQKETQRQADAMSAKDKAAQAAADVPDPEEMAILEMYHAAEAASSEGGGGPLFMAAIAAHRALIIQRMIAAGQTPPPNVDIKFP